MENLGRIFKTEIGGKEVIVETGKYCEHRRPWMKSSTTLRRLRATTWTRSEGALKAFIPDGDRKSSLPY